MTIGDSYIKVSAHFRTCFYHIIKQEMGTFLFLLLHFFPCQLMSLKGFYSDLVLTLLFLLSLKTLQTSSASQQP